MVRLLYLYNIILRQSQLFGSYVIKTATHEQALFVPLRTWVSRGMLLIIVFDDQFEKHPNPKMCQSCSEIRSNKEPNTEQNHHKINELDNTR